MAGPGSNNVGRNSGAGSNKNTLLNQYSKRTAVGANIGTPSPAAPGDYGAYASQVMGLQQSLAGALALARSGAGAARGQYVVDRAAAKNLRVSETVAAENSALDRNLVGSSIDLSGRATAVTDAAAAQQAALAQRNQALAAIQNQKIQAVGGFYTGLGSAQAQLAQAQAQAQIQRFQQDMFDTQTTNFAALRKAVLARLRDRGRVRDGVRPGPYDPRTDPNFDNGGTQGHLGGSPWTRPIGPIHSVGPHPY